MVDQAESTYDAELLALIDAGLAREASDLHLVAGHSPMLRVHGDLLPAGSVLLTGKDTARMVESMLPSEFRARFDSQKDFDFSLQLERPSGMARFRANVFRGQGGHGGMSAIHSLVDSVL